MKRLWNNLLDVIEFVFGLWWLWFIVGFFGYALHLAYKQDIDNRTHSAYCLKHNMVLVSNDTLGSYCVTVQHLMESGQ